jgi:hypothetical protein
MWWVLECVIPYGIFLHAKNIGTKERKKTKSALEPPSSFTLPFGFLKTMFFSFSQFAKQFFFLGLESATRKLVIRRGLWQGCHGNLEALYVALSCVSMQTPTRFYYKVCICIVRSWTTQPCRTWNIDTHCKWCWMFSLSDQLSSSRWTSSQGGISCVCFVPNDLICCAWSKKQCKTHSVCWALSPTGQ